MSSFIYMVLRTLCTNNAQVTGLRTQCAASAQLLARSPYLLVSGLLGSAQRGVYGYRKRLGSFPSLRTTPYNNTPIPRVLLGLVYRYGKRMVHSDSII